VILRSIRVSGWRCFAEPIEVGPFSPRLTVLHAPNATGKSTLFEALQRGLLDDPATRAEHAEQLRPWGRSLTPTVQVVFEHQQRIFRATKHFLDRPSGDRPAALLEDHKGGGYERSTEGTAAVDALRRLLKSTPPGRGLSRSENWGLAQILWAPQDQPHLGGFSGDLVARIRESLGTQVAGTGGSGLEQALEQAYLQFFTPKGQLRRGKNASLLAQLLERREEAVKGRDEAAQRQRLLEKIIDNLESLRARRGQSNAHEEEVRARLAEERAALRRNEELASARDVFLARARAGEKAYEALSSQIQRIADTAKLLAESEARSQALADDLPALRALVDGHTAATESARSALEDARAQRETRDLHARAEDARRWRSLSESAHRLTIRVSEVEAATIAMKALVEERAAVRAPDAAAFTAIQKLATEVRELRLRLDTQLITVEIVPSTKGAVRILFGEPSGEHTTAPQRPLTVRGTPEVVFDVAEFGRVRARGPVGDAPKLQAKLADTTRQLSALCEPYGTRDVAALEALRETARALDERIARAETQIEALLSGSTAAALREELERAVNERSALAARYPEWRDKAPDADALAAEASARQVAVDEEVARAESSLTTAQAQERQRREQFALRDGESREIRNNVASLRAQLTSLRADGRTDAERHAQLQAASLEATAARARYEEAAAKLTALGESPAPLVETLERQLTAAADLARESMGNEREQYGKLQLLAAEGTYTALAEAEERLAQIDADIARESLRADSLRLLRDTVAACREETIADVVRPVEEEATRLLRRVAGGGLGSLRLDGSFAPQRVAPPVADALEVDVDALSGGETEQVHLVTRLALAKVISGGQRQLVVLDDALTATDAGRFARILNLLDEASETLQIVALTCHPERYRGLADATFIDLEKTIAAAAT